MGDIHDHHPRSLKYDFHDCSCSCSWGLQTRDGQRRLQQVAMEALLVLPSCHDTTYSMASTHKYIPAALCPFQQPSNILWTQIFIKPEAQQTLFDVRHLRLQAFVKMKVRCLRLLSPTTVLSGDREKWPESGLGTSPWPQGASTEETARRAILYSSDNASPFFTSDLPYPSKLTQ